MTTRRDFLSRIAISQAGAEHTLVCVFLRGGADTLNLVVPYGDDRYYSLRPTIAIPPPKGSAESADAAIRLDDFHAFHPKMLPLVPLFREGRLGVVQAVGSDNSSGSHFEAQDQIEHGEGAGRTIGGGWLGRHLRTRTGNDLTPLSAVAIGPTAPESLRGAPSVSAIKSIDELQLVSIATEPATVKNALSALYDAEPGMLREPGRTTLELLSRVESLRAKSYRPQNGAAYPEDDFGSGLREIARLIKAGVGLEVACLDLGGWDTHFFQGTTDGLQADQIDILSRGLAAFDSDLKSLRDRVTVVVMTEFGRRVYENGSLGTDHGRGFALLALGGRINGGRIHGKWPGLEEEDAGWLGPAGLKVLIDYRSVLSEILQKVLNNPRTDQVFPGFMPQPIGI
ncbi:MAG: DUF1501 domain-containing protein [Acidobacteriota bacterium]|nr:MAG: DUF1501 domain-containing protein [Acidobacteriota bacterium]